MSKHVAQSDILTV